MLQKPAKKAEVHPYWVFMVQELLPVKKDRV
jgi:hypothetical protein